VRQLLRSFVDAAVATGATAPVADVEAAAMDLLRRWREPHRGYHDVEHLSEVLDRLNDLGCSEPEARLAAWFHDAVYRGEPGADERASADLARTELLALGVPPPRTERVVALVAVTATHEPPAGDAGAAALCDADLAVLAADPQRYSRYVAGVRREYTHLDDAVFAAGRAQVLRRLLERPALFATATGYSRWEPLARENIAGELEQLRD
jgi:predicted metal-dependent HD superfamily phosphohydrolase